MSYKELNKSVSEPIKEMEQEETSGIKNLAYCAFIAGIANPQLKSGELNSFFEEWYSRNYSTYKKD